MSLLPIRTVLPVAIAAMTIAVVSVDNASARSKLEKGEVKAIAEEAFIYGFPMVMNYGVYYESFVDTASSQYKAPFNQLYNTARVYTPADTAVVTPNSDTPYSFIGMDLRAEPIVICNPDIEKSRYFSLQLIDMYTFNYGYMGTRTTGNAAHCALIAGPRWKGKVPKTISTVFRSETDFSLGLIRTQLFNAVDIDNVKKIQAGYRALPLSQFEGRAAKARAAAVKWPKIDKELGAKDPFGYLNFLLSYAPATGPAAVEAPMRARFAKIGIAVGKPFDVAKLSADQKEDIRRMYDLPVDAIAVIGGGYDDTLFTRGPKRSTGTVQLLYAGKLNRSKGVPWLLRSLMIIADHDWHLHLAGSGSGPEYDECVALARQLGGRATLHGHVSHSRLADLMQQAHIQVLPSFFEGLPLVLFEGLASGCRIIATELSGFREFFGNAGRDTVRLIPLPPLETIDRPHPADEARLIDLLADTVIEMIAAVRRCPDVNDPQADHIAAEYTWPRVFERTISVYVEVLNASRVRGSR